MEKNLWKKNLGKEKNALKIGKPHKKNEYKEFRDKNIPKKKPRKNLYWKMAKSGMS